MRPIKIAAGPCYFEFIKKQKYYVEMVWPQKKIRYYAENRESAEEQADFIDAITIHTLDNHICAQRGTLKDKFVWLN